MTPRQIELARHAMGFRTGITTSWRNSFVTGPGSDDFADWEAMVAAGEAYRRDTREIFGGDYSFHLTEFGARQALSVGEGLCHNAFPLHQAEFT